MCIKKSLGEKTRRTRSKATSGSLSLGRGVGHERAVVPVEPGSLSPEWGSGGRGSAGPPADPQEPPWVEVLVEILLALLAQPSHLMRQVARSVFGHICSHLTPRALQLILDVSWACGEPGPGVGPSWHQAASQLSLQGVPLPGPPRGALGVALWSSLLPRLPEVGTFWRTRHRAWLEVWEGRSP